MEKKDIFQLLKNDHREVKIMLNDLLDMAKGEKRVNLFNKMKIELLVHAHAEDELFYDRVLGEVKKPGIILEAKEEHRVIEFLLSELEDKNMNDEDWKAKMTVLQESVDHHVDEEESDVFDAAKKIVTKEEAYQIADRVKARKLELKSQGIPPFHLPQSERKAAGL